MRKVYCDLVDKLASDITNEFIKANLIIDEGIKKNRAKVILNLMVNGFIRGNVEKIKEEFKNGKDDEKAKLLELAELHKGKLYYPASSEDLFSCRYCGKILPYENSMFQTRIQTIYSVTGYKYRNYCSPKCMKKENEDA